MRVIIAGGRDFNDYELLKKQCDKILSNQEEVEIVSGGAKGADKLGEKYAKERGYPITVMGAMWKDYGKAAGLMRNAQMASYANALIAFWDGYSRGTDNMIQNAKSKNLKTRIVRYN